MDTQIEYPRYLGSGCEGRVMQISPNGIEKQWYKWECTWDRLQYLQQRNHSAILWYQQAPLFVKQQLRFILPVRFDIEQREYGSVIVSYARYIPGQEFDQWSKEVLDKWQQLWYNYLRYHRIFNDTGSKGFNTKYRHETDLFYVYDWR